MPKFKNSEPESKLYSVWCNMRKRCLSPSSKNYEQYGGRGITICEEWSDYNIFREWALSNGYVLSAASGLCTLDRIDNEKGYSPENCRWTTHKNQQRNKRNNNRISFRGETHCLTEWAEITGISRNTLNSRYRGGWPPETMLTAKPTHKNTWAGLNGKLRGAHINDG